LERTLAGTASFQGADCRDARSEPLTLSQMFSIDTTCAASPAMSDFNGLTNCGNSMTSP